MAPIDRKTLLDYGQHHLLKRYDESNEAQRRDYFAPLDEAPLPWIIEAIEASGSGSKNSPGKITPPQGINGSDTESPQALQARAIGENLLREGKVAILLVAGGMGTRLGWNGPKGTFPVGPVSDRSLFQIFAEQIQGLQDQFGHQILWAIQTSGANHADTVDFFRRKEWFGLKEEQVKLFSQGTLPALLENKSLSIASDGSLVCLPDGHGGVYRALSKKGVIDWLEAARVEHVYYFQVDNPLSILADPQFMGYHAQQGSEMSTMVIKKREPEERVGVLAFDDGVLRVIEYSEIDPQLAARQDADGQLSLRAGNTGIHAFRLEFLKKMGAQRALPVHVAKKPVPTESGTKEMGYKLEYFVFDALGVARSPLVYEVLREGNFAPVKNAEGNDSPETSKNALLNHHRNSLLKAGCPVGPARRVEVSFRLIHNQTAMKELYSEGTDPLIIQ